MTAVPGGAGMEAAIEAGVMVWIHNAGWDVDNLTESEQDDLPALRADMRAFLLAALPHLSADRGAEDGQANDCRHDSATGVDTAPIGPGKVWRCDHCALTWTDAGRSYPADSDVVDTTRLSNESMEAIGTSIQNAAGGVDFPLPEYVAVAIAENLIASTWLADRIKPADRDALAAEVTPAQACVICTSITSAPSSPKQRKEATMGEAPDIREQEDCPSGAACDWACDQHEDFSAALTAFVIEQIEARSFGEIGPHRRAGIEADVAEFLAREDA